MVFYTRTVLLIQRDQTLLVRDIGSWASSYQHRKASYHPDAFRS